MSNTKHLADLLKVCSILPALVIMPAMAETEIIEERIKLESDKVYQTDILAKDIVGSQGGVFYVGQNVGLVFADDATFQNNIAQAVNVHGGAIYNEGNVVFGDDAKFIGNKSYSSAGAIRNLSTGEITFNGDAEFDGNLVIYSSEFSKAGNSGAIGNDGKIVFNGDATFKNNSTLDRKDAYSQGGAIYNNGEIEFNGAATFTGNTSFNKGNVFVNSDKGKMTFKKGIVVDGNGAITEGKDADSNGINNSGVLSITGGDAIFTNNKAAGIAGISSSGTLTIDAGQSGKILFENNTTRDAIVGLYASGANATLTADTISFKNNIQTSKTAKVYGGAVYNGGSVNQGVLNLLAKNIVFEGNQVNGFQDGHKKIGGGAIYNRGGGDKASVTETVVGLEDGTSTILFKDNSSAQHGGAIFARTDDGKGFDTKLTLNGNIEFSGNQAGENGGAIMNWTDGTGGLTDIVFNGEVDFENNNAGQNGGAIYNTGTVDLSKAVAEFDGNIASLEGGAIYNQGDVKIAKAEFEDNKASVYGGAISNRATMTIQDAKFEENISYGYYGGAIYNAGKGVIDSLVADFENNKVLKDGFAIGGAIANIGKIGDVNAAFGGNTVNASGEGASAKGGAIYTYAGSTIDSLVADFINNQAYSDGESIGGAVVNDGKIAKLHQAGKGFISNTSEGVVDGWAGALYNSEKAVISDLAANFASNTVTGGAQAFGGALVNKGTIEGLSGTFVNNVAVATSRDGKAFGGAIYNEGIINFVDDVVFSGNVANGSANDIHNLGTLNITDGTTTFGGGVSGNGTLTLAQGATMDIGTSLIHQDSIDLYGTVKVSLLNAGNDDKRAPNYGKFHSDDITVDLGAKFELSVGAVGTYNIWGAADVAKDQVFVGDIYEIAEMDANGVRIVTKSVDEIAETVGISTQAAGAVAGLANANSGKAHQVSLALQKALNAGDAEYVERETKKLNPTDKPVAQAAATSVQNQVLALTAGRMAGGVSVGRAGGDESSQENGFWIQGLFNKSKFGGEFHGYTRGVALGADTLIDRKWTIGGGLATNNSDVHADGSHTDIDSKTVFLYGQYKPNNWFVNATATYNMAEYTEHKNSGGIALMDTYDVDSYGVQVMTGYDFTPGITTEAGVRYLNVSQDAYTQESGFQVGAVDTKFLSGVAGLKYAFAIENDWAIQLRPELRAAATYDFVSDDAYATVVMPGVASYQVETERLSRMGGEFGIGLTAQYKGMEVSLMYDLDLHRDYTSQTGMIKFRGRF